MIIRDHLLDLGYPTAPTPRAFEPRVLPVSLADVARGVLWTTALDPLLCTVAQFEAVVEALAELPISEAVLELLPDLRLAHLCLVLGDHDTLAAIDALTEVAYFMGKNGTSREEAEELCARYAAAFGEYAHAYYARAEHLLGLR